MLEQKARNVHETTLCGSSQGRQVTILHLALHSSARQRAKVEQDAHDARAPTNNSMQQWRKAIQVHMLHDMVVRVA